MHPLTWWTLLAPAALFAVSLTPSGAANAFPRAMAAAGLGAGVVAFLVAIAVDVAVLLNGAFWTGAIGVAGVGVGIYFDALSAAMSTLVSFIGVIVLLYSRNYLDGDRKEGSFFKRLAFTLAAVLSLISAGNLAWLILAWIATSVGLNALLLFYPERPAAQLAAKKKFVASRLGDLCLIAAAASLWTSFGTLAFPELFAAARAAAAAGAAGTMALPAILIVCAAVLKSAQLPFHGWLVEVMETPTPVSALLHAGVINAGGFLVLRLADIVAPSEGALHMLSLIGGATALFGSIVMLTQTSVKVSLAYSTVAQMGFMILECGLGAFVAALLHILAHSLYKAHAFLSSGSVIDLARASWTEPRRPAPSGPFRAGACRILARGFRGRRDVPCRRHRKSRRGDAGDHSSHEPCTSDRQCARRTDQSLCPRQGDRHVRDRGRRLLYPACGRRADFCLQPAASRPAARPGRPHPRYRGHRLLRRGDPLPERHGPACDLSLLAGGLRPSLAGTLSQHARQSRDAPHLAAAGDEVLSLITKDLKMSAHVQFPSNSSGLSAPVERRDIEDSITKACGRIAPLWPLKHFVAVNPFLGFADQPFAATAAALKRVAKIEMLAPRHFYRAAIGSGVIDDDALGEALARAPKNIDRPADIGALKRAIAKDATANVRPPAAVSTVAEVLDTLADGDRQASLVGFMIEEISKWCAAYFDEGQASWRMPQRALAPYAAWRRTARYDLSAEAMGVANFRKTVLSLPEDPIETIRAVVETLRIPPHAVKDYLLRTLLDIGGWAAYARYLVWDSELNGEKKDTLVQLLAIRVAYGYGLFEARTDMAFHSAWSTAMTEAASTPLDHRLNEDPDLAVDLILHEAYEIAFQKKLYGRLSAFRGARLEPTGAPRLALQATFCIDVRSEVFRRALETVWPEAQTVGFAGFFGFPIEYAPIGHLRGGAQCPVLLKPTFTICEAVEGVPPSEERRILDLRLLRRRAAKAWKAFKLSAVSSFAFVETVGLSYAAKIVSDSLGLTRPAPDPNLDGLDCDVLPRVGPRLDARLIGERATGLSADQRLAMAEAVLKAMSMRDGFARLVLLAGHGSTTVNNPHASGLDCGACGGHTGEANARVAAGVLNDPGVRAGLRGKGIVDPEDTWFLAALHDTTTDEVKIFDEAAAPPSHRDEIAALRKRLAAAAELARLERAALLGIEKGPATRRKVLARSRDWSQVRPEWGLAGNAAFIAAPRARTAGLDLGGRAFLHSYDFSKDEGGKVLELIMTAPMVVASWINLQYFGSTTNNRVFGSGNKTLHNVVGQLGVFEGNGGDLRTGLPLQSVHDGKRFVHEPLRLNVFIEAPEAAIEAVLRKNASVRALVENGWLHLHALQEDGRIRRFHALGDWRDAGAAQQAA